MNTQTQSSALRPERVKVVTLLENAACREGLASAHGLSLYLETPRHRILFDMGPDGAFAENAAALGVDLKTVDLAVLSHGHYDHGGGLAAFCRCNDTARIYIRRDAFGEFLSADPGQEPHYIGLPEDLELFRERFVLTGPETKIDEELTLFAEPPMVFDAMKASASLMERTAAGIQPDAFSHEQNLLITAGETAVVVAGCAHRGMVNIAAEARRRLGRDADAVIGGFHLFQLGQDAQADDLIDATGRALLPGKTVYYTGHCTGDYAFHRLSGVLGDRLRPLHGGTEIAVEGGSATP